MARIKIVPKRNLSRVVAAEPVVIKSAQLAIVSALVPRGSLTVPISPVPLPTGNEVFEPPAGGRMLYLPEYRLQHSRVGSVDRPAVTFLHDEQAGRWGLQVILIKVPPDALMQAAGNMDAMSHELQLTLSYKPSPDAVTRREHVFADVTQDATTATGTLWATSIMERDAIYQALSTAASETQLTAVRQISVAIEAQGGGPGLTVLEDGANDARLAARAQLARARLAAEPAQAQLRQVILADRNLQAIMNRRDQVLAARNALGDRDALPKPRVVITDFEAVRQGGSRAARFEFTIRNINDFGAALFRRKRRISGLGNARPARLVLEVFDPETGRIYLRDGMRVQGPPDSVRKLTFVPTNGRLPRALVFRCIDTARNRRVESRPIPLRQPRPAPVDPPPPQASFAVMDLSLPQIVEPAAFVFPVDQHPEIYAALAAMPPVPVQGGLARHRESYEGRVHSYFQDIVSPRTIHFLPDAFKIARHSGFFRPPQATVRVRTVGLDTDAAEVTLDYVIAPYVDLARLSDAAEKIADATGIDPATMEFQPYLTDVLSYSLSRPGVSGRVTEDRPTSPLMLQEPMVDTLVLPVADFQIAFDAMVGKTASVINGQVTFTVEGWGEETRGVTLDFKDMSGPALDVDDISEVARDNAATINLINAIESPVAFEGVVVMATRDGMTTPVEGLEVMNASGTRLTPGTAEAVPVIYEDLPGTGPAGFEVLKSGQVVPDADAVMNAILDRASLEYFREIEVRTVPTIFPDPADNPPPDGIFALMVEFENGQAVVLDATTSQETVRVDFSFADVILGHEADDGSYRYFRTIVRFDGSQERDGSAITSTSPILFVTPSVNPAVPDDPGTG